uniref:Calpain catalytic domain-containing protein n=1 Tax=Chromera velia CCMP2878 TaxID=1169474 RepID=A0A0G4F2L8_9ALVE|eukprot:Cvel_2648.t1-p1 / transcript=Cvel_2648.t1 / gene=Cvel_2648 / organism=Chromera_velia_CCMP2878 / gene_product=Calpain-15, putative / transcript_product=Calpain-15, putative / location=Cvel_scaffold105:48316-63463(+) / protein_length=3384 / sequence_SO=supercontig / SO=protein_coding / is_pseudo=false
MTSPTECYRIIHAGRWFHDTARQVALQSSKRWVGPLVASTLLAVVFMEHCRWNVRFGPGKLYRFLRLGCGRRLGGAEVAGEVPNLLFVPLAVLSAAILLAPLGFLGVWLCAPYDTGLPLFVVNGVLLMVLCCLFGIAGWRVGSFGRMLLYRGLSRVLLCVAGLLWVGFQGSTMVFFRDRVIALGGVGVEDNWDTLEEIEGETAGYLYSYSCFSVVLYGLNAICVVLCVRLIFWPRKADVGLVFEQLLRTSEAEAEEAAAPASDFVRRSRTAIDRVPSEEPTESPPLPTHAEEEGGDGLCLTGEEAAAHLDHSNSAPCERSEKEKEPQHGGPRRTATWGGGLGGRSATSSSLGEPADCASPGAHGGLDSHQLRPPLPSPYGAERSRRSPAGGVVDPDPAALAALAAEHKKAARLARSRVPLLYAVGLFFLIAHAMAVCILPMDRVPRTLREKPPAEQLRSRKVTLRSLLSGERAGGEGGKGTGVVGGEVEEIFPGIARLGRLLSIDDVRGDPVFSSTLDDDGDTVVDHDIRGASAIAGLPSLGRTDLDTGDDNSSSRQSESIVCPKDKAMWERAVFAGWLNLALLVLVDVTIFLAAGPRNPFRSLVGRLAGGGGDGIDGGTEGEESVQEEFENGWDLLLRERDGRRESSFLLSSELGVSVLLVFARFCLCFSLNWWFVQHSLVFLVVILILVASAVSERLPVGAADLQFRRVMLAVTAVKTYLQQTRQSVKVPGGAQQDSLGEDGAAGGDEGVETVEGGGLEDSVEGCTEREAAAGGGGCENCVGNHSQVPPPLFRLRSSSGYLAAWLVQMREERLRSPEVLAILLTLIFVVEIGTVGALYTKQMIPEGALPNFVFGDEGDEVGAKTSIMQTKFGWLALALLVAFSAIYVALRKLQQKKWSLTRQTVGLLIFAWFACNIVGVALWIFRSVWLFLWLALLGPLGIGPILYFYGSWVKNNFCLWTPVSELEAQGLLLEREREAQEKRRRRQRERELQRGGRRRSRSREERRGPNGVTQRGRAGQSTRALRCLSSLPPARREDFKRIFAYALSFVLFGTSIAAMYFAMSPRSVSWLGWGTVGAFFLGLLLWFVWEGYFGKARWSGFETFNSVLFLLGEAVWGWCLWEYFLEDVIHLRREVHVLIVAFVLIVIPSLLLFAFSIRAWRETGWNPQVPPAARWSRLAAFLFLFIYAALCFGFLGPLKPLPWCALALVVLLCAATFCVQAWVRRGFFLPFWMRWSLGILSTLCASVYLVFAWLHNMEDESGQPNGKKESNIWVYLTPPWLFTAFTVFAASWVMLVRAQHRGEQVWLSLGYSCSLHGGREMGRGEEKGTTAGEGEKEKKNRGCMCFGLTVFRHDPRLRVTTLWTGMPNLGLLGFAMVLVWGMIASLLISPASIGLFFLAFPVPLALALLSHWEIEGSQRASVLEHAEYLSVNLARHTETAVAASRCPVKKTLLFDPQTELSNFNPPEMEPHLLHGRGQGWQGGGGPGVFSSAPAAVFRPRKMTAPVSSGRKSVSCAASLEEEKEKQRRRFEETFGEDQDQASSLFSLKFQRGERQAAFAEEERDPENQNSALSEVEAEGGEDATPKRKSPCGWLIGSGLAERALRAQRVEEERERRSIAEASVSVEMRLTFVTTAASLHSDESRTLLHLFRSLGPEFATAQPREISTLSAPVRRKLRKAATERQQLHLERQREFNRLWRIEAARRRLLEPTIGGSVSRSGSDSRRQTGASSVSSSMSLGRIFHQAGREGGGSSVFPQQQPGGRVSTLLMGTPVEALGGRELPLDAVERQQERERDVGEAGRGPSLSPLGGLESPLSMVTDSDPRFVQRLAAAENEEEEEVFGVGRRTDFSSALALFRSVWAAQPEHRDRDRRSRDRPTQTQPTRKREEGEPGPFTEVQGRMGQQSLREGEATLKAGEEEAAACENISDEGERLVPPATAPSSAFGATDTDEPTHMSPPFVHVAAFQGPAANRAAPPLFSPPPSTSAIGETTSPPVPARLYPGGGVASLTASPAPHSISMPPSAPARPGVPRFVAPLSHPLPPNPIALTETEGACSQSQDPVAPSSCASRGSPTLAHHLQTPFSETPAGEETGEVADETEEPSRDFAFAPLSSVHQGASFRHTTDHAHEFLFMSQPTTECKPASELLSAVSPLQQGEWDAEAEGYSSYLKAAPVPLSADQQTETVSGNNKIFASQNRFAGPSQDAAADSVPPPHRLRLRTEPSPSPAEAVSHSLPHSSTDPPPHLPTAPSPDAATTVVRWNLPSVSVSLKGRGREGGASSSTQIRGSPQGGSVMPRGGSLPSDAPPFAFSVRAHSQDTMATPHGHGRAVSLEEAMQRLGAAEAAAPEPSHSVMSPFSCSARDQEEGRVEAEEKEDEKEEEERRGPRKKVAAPSMWTHAPPKKTGIMRSGGSASSPKGGGGSSSLAVPGQGQGGQSGRLLRQPSGGRGAGGGRGQQSGPGLEQRLLHRGITDVSGHTGLADTTLERIVRGVRSMHERCNVRFKDSDQFPPSHVSILGADYQPPSLNARLLAGGSLYAGLSVWEQVYRDAETRKNLGTPATFLTSDGAGCTLQWVRPERVYGRPVCLFSASEDVPPSLETAGERGWGDWTAEVDQGELGSCWLLAALTVLATKPRLIQQIFHESCRTIDPLSVYALRFHSQGRVRPVIVDDLCPCLSLSVSGGSGSGSGGSTHVPSNSGVLTGTGTGTAASSSNSKSPPLPANVTVNGGANSEGGGSSSVAVAVASVAPPSVFPETGLSRKPLFARPGWHADRDHYRPPPIWPILVEKAYAKLHGSFRALEGGLVHLALGDLTGGWGDVLPLKPLTRQAQQQQQRQQGQMPEGMPGPGSAGVGLAEGGGSSSSSSTAAVVSSALQGGGFSQWQPASAYSQEQLWDRVRSAHVRGFLLGAGTGVRASEVMGHSVSALGIVRGHAYAILDVRDVDGFRLVKLRNPWGAVLDRRRSFGGPGDASQGGVWLGEFCDGSPSWTVRLLNLLGERRAVQRRRRFGDAGGPGDGTFWLLFADFCEEFDDVYICRVFEEGPGGSGDGGGMPGSPSLPQPLHGGMGLRADRDREGVLGVSGSSSNAAALPHPRWKKKVFHGRWSVSEGTAGGSTNFRSVWRNPHFLLTVQAKTMVYAVLQQEPAPAPTETETERERETAAGGQVPPGSGRRRVEVQGSTPVPPQSSGVVGGGQSEETVPGSRFPPIALELYAFGHRVTGAEGDWQGLVNKHDSYCPVREVCREFALVPGRVYTLLTSTFEAGQEGEFALTVFSETAAGLSIKPAPAPSAEEEKALSEGRQGAGSLARWGTSDSEKSQQAAARVGGSPGEVKEDEKNLNKGKGWRRFTRGGGGKSHGQPGGQGEGPVRRIFGFFQRQTSSGLDASGT